MTSLSALLIINTQNDFLSPGGTFSKQHIEPAQLIDAIGWLVQAARQQQRAIVWITSEYDTTSSTPEELLGKTHAGKPCCVKDTWGCELVGALQAQFVERSDRELHVIKQWYDAFYQTELHHWLQQCGITKLSLCGVPTDVCVADTAKTAISLGYQVEILEEATAASTHGKHLATVRELAKLGVQTRNWGELLSEGNQVRLTQIAGDSVLDCAALSSCIGADTFDALYREVNWQQMSHRGSFVPRLVALQGTKAADGVEPLYRHPADEQPPLQYWTPTVDAIRLEVERRIGHPLNHCLIQLYRDGRDWIGEHADKTLDVIRPSFIVNVSLGTTRTMVFRAKNSQNARTASRLSCRTQLGGSLRVDAPLRQQSQKLPLPHGSLFMLSLNSNRAFYHEIKRQGADGTNAPRISLTLRYIGTYYDPLNGAVWGIGAPSKTRAEANARVEWLQTFDPRDRLARDKDEAERMVKLFRAENIDENFDAAAYQPGFDILNFQGLL